MPVVSPEYCTGRRLWLLAMPASVRPRATGIEGGDPGLQPGIVSTVVRSLGGTGTVSIYSGGPTDTFAVRVEIVAGGALGTATFRTRLQLTEAFSATQPTPANGLYELPESGMVLLFAGPFALGETHDFTTTEAAQQRELRKGISGEIASVLRTRGTLPLAEWGVDIELLAARCLAWEMLGLRGYDPRSEHDKLILHRAKRAWSQLRKLREEIVQGDWAGQDSPLGIQARSQKPEAVDLW